MGTQGTGRKRNPNKERSTVEEDALNLIAREAEARLAAKRAARAEAREIRMKELERQQKEISDDEERVSVGIRESARAEDRDYLEKSSRTTSIKSSTTLAYLGGTSSRRGSGETSITADTETSIREVKEIHELKDQIQDVETKYMQNLKEVKDALVVVEEKYRKAMVSNAQLDNEKNNLMYYVDTLKDSLMELEELLSESRREYEEKAKEYEREKHNHSVLQFQFNELKETIKQSEELLTKHGIILGPDLSVNGETIEPGSDGPVSSDLASRPALDSQTSPTEGNSILGRADEMQLDGRGEMDQAPEQQDMHDENCPISSNICSLSHDSVKQPYKEEHVSFSVKKNEVKSATSISEMNSEVSDLRERPEEVVTVDDCSKDSIGANVVRKSAGDLRGTNDIEQAIDKVTTTDLGTQVFQCGDDTEDTRELLQEQPYETENDESCQTNVRCFDPSSPSGELVLDTIKACAHDNSIHSHVIVNLESEKSEEIQELSQDVANDQPQTTASSRKKKKKKKVKKKGVIQEDQTQKGDMREKGMAQKIKVDKVELAGSNDSSATEPLKESQAKPDKDVQASVEKQAVWETQNEDARNSEPFPNKEADVNLGDPSDHFKIQTIHRDTSKDRFESTSKSLWPESESIDCSKEESTNLYNPDSDNTNFSTADKNDSGNNESQLSITDSTFELTTNSSLKDPVLEFSTSTEFISIDPAWSRENEMGLNGVNRAAKPENTPQPNNTLATSSRNKAYSMCHNTSLQSYCNTPEDLSCLAKSQLQQDHVDEGPVLAKDVEDPTSQDSLRDEGYPSYSLEEKQKDQIMDKVEDEETSQEPIEMKSENENIGKSFDFDDTDVESVNVGSAISPEEEVPEEPNGSKLEQSKDETKVLQNNLPIVQQEEEEDEGNEMVIQVENMGSASKDHQPPQNKGKDSEKQLNTASEGNGAIGDNRETPETKERESGSQGLAVDPPVEEGVEAILYGLHGTQLGIPNKDEQAVGKYEPSRRGSKNNSKKGNGKEDCKMS